MDRGVNPNKITLVTSDRQLRETVESLCKRVQVLESEVEHLRKPDRQYRPDEATVLCQHCETDVLRSATVLTAKGCMHETCAEEAYPSNNGDGSSRWQR